MAKHIAIVTSTVGFHWEEVFGAYDEFLKAGWDVDFFTVDGSAPVPDPLSLKPTGPFAWLGLGMPSSISPDTRRGQEIQAGLDAARSLIELDPDEFDSIYLPGGHGCLFDMNRDETLHAIIGQLYRDGKPLSGVCHATSTFAYVQNDGDSIVKDKQLTGFPHPLDQAMSGLGLLDESFRPIPIVNDEVLMNAGADIKWYHRLLAMIYPGYTRSDWPFITGMGPKAARHVARRLIAELQKRSI